MAICPTRSALSLAKELGIHIQTVGRSSSEAVSEGPSKDRRSTRRLKNCCWQRDTKLGFSIRNQGHTQGVGNLEDRQVDSDQLGIPC
jgi:hypothetical protein